MTSSGAVLAFSFLVVSAGTTAVAQDAGVRQDAVPSAMQLPWNDVAPHVDATRGAVVTIALGVADERRGPLAAQRLWARREAEARARSALHAWADAAIARASLDATAIAAMHAAIDAHASVVATRARVDGSACVEVALPLRELAATTGSARGLPWSG
jgi:hypothetical protein